MQENIYIIGIGGIGISAIARYYLAQGATVYGDDANHSELTNTLAGEGVIFCSFKDVLKKTDIQKILYTEAVPTDNHELVLARENKIEILSYPQALAEIANNKKLITVAGTHGKSTTTSLCSLVLKNSDEDFTSVVGTLLKEFGNKNFYHRHSSIEKEDTFFVIEACEYKRSFLNYTPTVGIITNIEADHLDYFKDEIDYVDAFISYAKNIKSGGFLILNGEDTNCQKLIGLRNDIQYIEVFENYFSFDEKIFHFPKIHMQVAGKHILFDAKIAYILGYMLGIPEADIIKSLEGYTGVWRRMENIGTTEGGNILMSDYGHHPTEIQLTLGALKEKHPEKQLYVVFQPHQHNRTLELLEEFTGCFNNADTLIIPNIYASRDSKEDIQNMTPEKFVGEVQHSHVFYGEGLENTSKLIQEYDMKNQNSSIILLLGAGNIDNLRNKIVTN